jgi:hypothetical protein
MRIRIHKNQEPTFCGTGACIPRGSYVAPWFFDHVSAL